MWFFQIYLCLRLRGVNNIQFVIIFSAFIITQLFLLESKLREVERKINLENAHYEELMLELSLRKKEQKKTSGISTKEHHLTLDDSLVETRKGKRL